MSTTFGFSQGDVGATRVARVIVPGTGRNENPHAPIVMIEKDGEKLTLFVYADILSKEPTHEISLNGALLTKKEAK